MYPKLTNFEHRERRSKSSIVQVARRRYVRRASELVKVTFERRPLLRTKSLCGFAGVVAVPDLRIDDAGFEPFGNADDQSEIPALIPFSIIRLTQPDVE